MIDFGVGETRGDITYVWSDPIISPHPLPTGLIESFTVILNDARADVIREIGVGGVCQLSGAVDGDAIRQSAKIEAIEPIPEGGVKASFVWAPDETGEE